MLSTNLRGGVRVGRLHSFGLSCSGRPTPLSGTTSLSLRIVLIDEGQRLVSNIVQCDIGAPGWTYPWAVFDDVTPEWTLVKFKPA